MQNYISFYSEWKGRFVLVWLMYLVKAAPVFLIPILTAEVINLITNRAFPQDQVFTRLWQILAIGVVVIAQNVPTHMLYVRLMSVPCRAVEMGLRSALCTRLQHLSIPYHTSTRMGSLQNKVTRDVESIENMRTMPAGLLQSRSQLRSNRGSVGSPQGLRSIIRIFPLLVK